MLFLNPQVLWLAPCAALVAVLFVLAGYIQRERILAAYGQRHLLAPLSAPVSRWRYLIRACAAAVAGVALVLALARPVVPEGTRSIKRGTVDVVCVIDVSRSMAAMDYPNQLPKVKVTNPKTGKETWDEQGTRLEMVRHLMANRVLPALEGNQIGVVSYAGQAFPQAFLTRDQRALNWVLDRGLTISSAPGEGSAMGKALQLALDMFDADSPPEHERMIILLSDGGNDDSDKDMAKLAAEFKERGIKLVVMGMGNTIPSPIPVSKLAADDDVAEGLMHNGKKFYEVDGEVERTGLAAGKLQALAEAAGGSYTHVGQATDLSVVDMVGKTTLQEVPGTRELFPWALGAALAALVLQATITRRWRKRAKS